MNMNDTSCHCHHHHNVHHSDDVEIRLTKAVEHCLERGARFTPLREEVFRLILASDKPLGAYDLISAMQESRRLQDDKNKNIAPPTIYRSLEFLISEGLVHQLNSLNAYVPCCHPRTEHAAAFLICQECHSVEECSNIPVDNIINFAQSDAGFEIQQAVIELKGKCRACQ